MLEEIRKRWGSPLSTISKCLRGFLVASALCVLIVADFNAIEARVLTWLTDGDLSIFDDDPYKAVAGEMFGVPKDEVTPEQRQLGKVAMLACGYQGGVGAFQTMAKTYGVSVTDEVAQRVVELYRAANPNVVRFWKEIERAAIKAAMKPGEVVKVAAGRIAFRKVGSHLLCQLPSKRVITYPFARVGRKTVRLKDREPFEVDELRYGSQEVWGWNEETGTYGGKLAENVVQGIARDLLVNSMMLLDASGAAIVAHVHDEIVIEVPEYDTSSMAPDMWPGAPYSGTRMTIEEVVRVMEKAPVWAAGLPLKVEAWKGKRYGK